MALWLALCAQVISARAQATVSAAEQQGRLEKLVRVLRTDPSYQVRLQAAGVLGRLGQREAVPALVQALIEDRHELVRATCADALGQLGDLESRPALQAARVDQSALVRARAEAALQRLGAGTPGPAARSGVQTAPVERRVTVALGRMGSRAKGTARDLPKLLRDAIARELMSNPDVQVVSEGASLQGGFTIESSVTELSQRIDPSGQLEVNCEVSMVILLMPSRSIVGMTSGGATIQAPRRLSRGDKAARQALEMDALQHAVRGANQNLLAFLRSQR